MPKVVEVRPTGARARRDGRPNNSGEADRGVGGDTAVFRRNRVVAGEGDDATASTKETATSADAPTRDSSRLEGVQWHQCHWLPAGTRLRWSPRETEATPVEGKQLRRCWRRRRDRMTLRRGGRSGWRQPARRKEKGDGGNVAPGVSAGNGGQAGEEEAAAMLEEATARPAGVLTRRQGRLKTAGGTGERGRRRGGG
uniref:Uncharacterized protein n=1 Tax=Oryza sativa subsp. japonica TaxID=39947 RepID=Q75H44_ORYSJ|nr:hypothetical protein [Oryza sativa Japonica Group]AAV31283.1 hypothetical protein [Oryza sativa Japonica Group]